MAKWTDNKREMINSCQNYILIGRRNKKKGNSSLGKRRTLWRWPLAPGSPCNCGFTPGGCLFRLAKHMTTVLEEKVLFSVGPAQTGPVFSASPTLFCRVFFFATCSVHLFSWSPFFFKLHIRLFGLHWIFLRKMDELCLNTEQTSLT